MKKAAWIDRKKTVLALMPLVLLLMVACGGAAAALSPVSNSLQTPEALAAAEAQSVTETPTVARSIPVLDNSSATATIEPVIEHQPAGSGAVEAVEPTDVNAEPDAQEVESPQPAPESQVSNALDGITDDEIVAAHERVSIGLYDDVLPSVVRITVGQQISSSGLPFGTPPGDDENQDFFSTGEGSGFVWSSEGYIVTNRHVVADADFVLVFFADGTQAEAEVVGIDPDSDLAVLKVDLPAEKLPPVRLGDSGEAKVGQFAAAIGNPFGQEFTLTTGIVSAVGRTINSGSSQFSIPEVIQTDAAINPGNSGGPLLNRQGEVIGINTQIISRSGASSGVGFAVPIDVAKQVVPAIIENGSFEYSWLGISGTSLTPDVARAMNLPESTRGAILMNVTDGGPASEAGLKGSDRTQRINGGNAQIGGDVVIAINGTTITEMDDLISYLVVNTRPGDVVTFDVLHDGGEQAQIDVTLGARPR
jgi:2-alkenal reductase